MTKPAISRTWGDETLRERSFSENDNSNIVVPFPNGLVVVSVVARANQNPYPVLSIFRSEVFKFLFSYCLQGHKIDYFLALEGLVTRSNFSYKSLPRGCGGRNKKVAPFEQTMLAYCLFLDGGEECLPPL